MAMAVEEELLTTREVCTLLRCHRNTLVNYINRGMVAPIRITSRRNLFRRDEIDHLLSRHATTDAEVVRGALELLAEQHAEEERPLCPSCAKRRVSRGLGICTYCQQNADAQLQHKRNWWDKTGSSRRAAQRQASV